MEYLEAADKVGDWLLGAAQRQPEGWTWPVRPGVSTEVENSLYGGMAGPALFFVEAYRTTGETKWLDAARQGARWMGSHLEEAKAGWAGCGLFTGVGGWALVLDELAGASGDEEVAALAARAVETVMAGAEGDGAGMHWHGFSEIVWGTAGVGCLLLTVGRDRVGDRALDLAGQAGEWLLGYAEQAPTGVRWGLGPAYERQYPERANRRYPNFAHGTAGIAFFLARLAAETADTRFLEAALAGMDWVLSTVSTDDGGCAAFHHEPDGTDLYTLGWCHGPPGLASTFRQLEVSTGDTEWRKWASALRSETGKVVSPSNASLASGTTWHGAAARRALPSCSWTSTGSRAMKTTSPLRASWSTTFLSEPSSTPTVCAGRTTSSATPSPTCRPRRPICKERLGSGQRSCGCTAICRGTTGWFDGLMHRCGRPVLRRTGDE